MTDLVEQLRRADTFAPPLLEAATEIEHMRLWAAKTWQPMDTAPTDGTPILAAVAVHNNDKQFIYWDIHLIAMDEDTGEIAEDQGWSWNDYTHWLPIPSPPVQT